LWCVIFLLLAFIGCSSQKPKTGTVTPQETVWDRMYYGRINPHPKQADEFMKLGDFLSTRGQYDSAIANYTKAISVYRQERTNTNLAVALNNRAFDFERLGKNDLALADYSQASKLDPTLWQIHQNLARVLHGLGKYGEAITEYNETIRLCHACRYVYLNLFNAAMAAQADKSLYKKKLDSVVRDSTLEEWTDMLFKFYLGGDSVSENEVLEKARSAVLEKESDERLSDAYYYLGAKALNDGNRKKAMEYFKSCVTVHRVYMPSYLYSIDAIGLMENGSR
jgi:lipoprotein NlpI